MVRRESRFRGPPTGARNDDMDFPNSRRRDGLGTSFEAQQINASLIGFGRRCREAGGIRERDYDEQAMEDLDLARGSYHRDESDTCGRRDDAGGRYGARDGSVPDPRYLNHLLDNMNLENNMRSNPYQSRAGGSASRGYMESPSVRYKEPYSPYDLPELKRSRAEMVKDQKNCLLVGNEKGYRKASDEVAMIEEDIARVEHMMREEAEILLRGRRNPHRGSGRGVVQGSYRGLPFNHH